MPMRWLLLLGAMLGVGGCAADTGGGSDAEDLVDTASSEQAFSTDLNCADPSVLKDGATYVLTCTGFRIYTSTDLYHWAPRGELFPNGPPAWTSGNNWAAEIHHVPGGFAAYYTAQCGNRNCVGAAFNTQAVPDAAHPYQDLGGPLIPGSLSKYDPHVFIDGEDRYLYWVTNTLPSSPVSIWGAKLSPDGRRLIGEANRLMTAKGGWEGSVVEGPWVIQANGYFYMFYSGNVFESPNYAVGVARSRSPLGNFDDNRRGSPILDQGSRWVGPGHNSIARAPDGRLRLVYHAFKKGQTAADRKLLVAPLGFDKNDWPVVTAKL